MRALDWIKRLPIDLGQGWYRHTTKAKLLAFAKVGDGHERSALDFGCGDGFWSEQLKKQGWRVTSIDNYDTRYTGVQQVNAEGPLPFPDHAFDLVWVAEVIEHVRNIGPFIAELRRITKPGGRMILTTPNSAFWLYDVLRWFGITAQQIQNPDHKQFFSFKDMRALFPTADIRGFFPYALLKFEIRSQIGLLSPSFIILEHRP